MAKSAPRRQRASAAATKKDKARTAITAAIKDAAPESHFKQLVVWPDTKMGPGDDADLVSQFAAKGFRVRYVDCITTRPGLGGPGGRSDCFFYVHDDDVVNFSLAKILIGARWWEDVVANAGSCIYPESFVLAHPPTW